MTNKMNRIAKYPCEGAMIIDVFVFDELEKICEALVAITEIECCNYNFDDEVTNAKNFIEECKKYERRKI